MKIGDKKWNYCLDCYKSTNHTVLSFVQNDVADDYQSNYYTVVKCDGCNNITYRTEYVDHERFFEDEDGDWQPYTTIDTYPKALKNHRRLGDSYDLPKDIEMVYDEAINAFSSNCYLLTAIAFRTIIEAICINKSIKTKNTGGDSLGSKIDKMAKDGLITQNEAERLHTIVFKGNDSVHEMVIPKPQQLVILLDTIEHLLKNLYLIDKEFNNGLDEIIIKNFKTFRVLLSKEMSKYNIDDSLPLRKILGKSIRRLKNKTKELEKELQDKIKSGEYKYLVLGDVKAHPDPKLPNEQYYIIKNLSFELEDLGF